MSGGSSQTALPEYDEKDEEGAVERKKQRLDRLNRYYKEEQRDERLKKEAEEEEKKKGKVIPPTRVDGQY